ncbi:hypothetical protein MVEN_00463700 [Mycena venus]|uniref:Transmembrane protein n=1 Tax=Mycena venus TaxID=2733690 RepID=A0A8H6YVW4_9AGAR|nr:hypothetical protein MVEN_00463700 [Mycena venus]
MNRALFRVSLYGPGLLLQLWLLPPFLTIQSNPQPPHAMRAWKTEYISRLEYSQHLPFVRVVHTAKEALEREAYPVKLIRRKRRWETWPSPGWGEVRKNSRILLFQRLKEREYEAVRESLLRKIERHFIILALLAGVEAAALAVPGIETAHWLARACFFAGTALAVCGVIVGRFVSGIFDIFFGEDITATHDDPGHRFLTLDASPRLCHRIGLLYSWTGIALTASSLFFLGGVLAFIATTTFDAARPPSGASLIAFRVLSIFPEGVYMVQFFRRLVWCSFAHRRFRDGGKEQEEGGSVEP